MSFSKSDAGEVKAWLGKVTTAGDGIGRIKRDLVLMRALNPHWGDEVLAAFEQRVTRLTNVARDMDVLLKDTAEMAARLYPEET